MKVLPDQTKMSFEQKTEGEFLVKKFGFGRELEAVRELEWLLTSTHSGFTK